jgi:hypothetical protein
VGLALQSGVSIAKLAREHGINDNLLFNWRQPPSGRIVGHPILKISMGAMEPVMKRYSPERIDPEAYLRHILSVLAA